MVEVTCQKFKRVIAGPGLRIPFSPIQVHLVHLCPELATPGIFPLVQVLLLSEELWPERGLEPQTFLRMILTVRFLYHLKKYLNQLIHCQM